MTTPATENTAYAIICDAMRDAKLLPRGDDPDPEDLAEYTRRLNQLINFIMTSGGGVRLWLLQDTPVVLTQGQGLYTFGPTGTVVMSKPAQVYDQYYLYPASSGANRRPIFKISRREWDMLSTTTQQGPITQIFVDPQQTLLAVNTWLIPDANEALGTLHLVLQNQITNFVGITDGMNFPPEWAMALHWGLAGEICNGQPQAVINFCVGKAQYYLQELQDWDQEQGTSIMLQPDQRLIRPSRFQK